MNCCRLFLLAALLSLCSVAVSVEPADIPLSFPFFHSGQSTGISPELMVGYGDLCVIGEGAYAGTDQYSGLTEDSVLCLSGRSVYSIHSLEVFICREGVYGSWTAPGLFSDQFL